MAQKVLRQKREFIRKKILEVLLNMDDKTYTHYELKKTIYDRLRGEYGISTIEMYISRFAFEGLLNRVTQNLYEINKDRVKEELKKYETD